MHYLVPTVDLGCELAAAFGPEAKVIRGRLHEDRDGQTLCHKPEVMKRVAGRVQNVTRAMCVRYGGDGEIAAVCEHLKHCRYFAQFNRRDGLFLLSQEYAFQNMGERLLPRPDVVIIDETILPTLVARPRPFTPSEFIDSAREYADLARLIVRELEADRSPKPELRRQGWSGNRLRRAARQLDHTKIDDVLIPGMSEADVLRVSAQLPPTNYAAMVFRRLADEMGLQREAVYSLVMVKNMPVQRIVDGEITSVLETLLFVQYRRRMMYNANVPLLVLDGTADPRLLEIAFPGSKTVQVDATRNAVVVQAYGFRGSKSALTDDSQNAADHLQELQRFLDTLDGMAGLLVTHKDAIDKLTVGDGWTKAHFGNLRGLDSFKEKDIAVVVGRMQPSAVNMERFARGLAYDREINMTFLGKGMYPETERGYRMADGSQVGVRVPVHPDPIVQAALEQSREAEIVQAIDRLRLRWNPVPKLVILLTEIPVDVTVDALVPYTSLVAGSRVDVAGCRLGGFLPLNPAYLTKTFPELWGTEKAAKRDVQKERERRAGGSLSGPLLYKYFYRKGGLFIPAFLQFAREYLYRLPGQRGSESVCMSIHDAARTREWLQRTFGELADFIVPTNEGEELGIRRTRRRRR
jgi:hypothetical protein